MLLSIAAKRMAKRNVLVKDLRGVETLGAITCLATDKTGTLTRNQMTVTNIWTGGKLYDAFNPKEQLKKDKKPSAAAPVDYDQEGNMYALLALMILRNSLVLKPKTHLGTPACSRCRRPPSTRRRNSS